MGRTSACGHACFMIRASCANITRVDKTLLGRRLAQARDDAGLTQEHLARTVALDRTAISRLEKGERNLNAAELVKIAGTLGLPLSYFVGESVPAVISRRRDATPPHTTTHTLDVHLERLAVDAQELVSAQLLELPQGRLTGASTPRDHTAAERLAQRLRRHLNLQSGPIEDLGGVCEQLGLLVHVAPLGAAGPDGGCVEVESPTVFGVSVLNGDAPHGRRRMTLAHELGHWVTGDAYDARGSSDERMLNSFAIHFLAPRAGVYTVWDAQTDWPVRDRALAVGATFRLSWTAVLGQLRNLRLINQHELRTLEQQEPKRGDYLRRGLSWAEELQAPYLSPAFVTGCLMGFAARRLTTARTLELLRGTVLLDDLPQQRSPSREDLRRSFTGHDD